MRPLRWLVNWVAALPHACAARDHWYFALDEVRALEQRFAATALPGKQALLAALRGALLSAHGAGAAA